jgi:hypothetical protein
MNYISCYIYIFRILDYSILLYKYLFTFFNTIRYFLNYYYILFELFWWYLLINPIKLSAILFSINEKADLQIFSKNFSYYSQFFKFSLNLIIRYTIFILTITKWFLYYWSMNIMVAYTNTFLIFSLYFKLSYCCDDFSSFVFSFYIFRYIGLLEFRRTLLLS